MNRMVTLRAGSSTYRGRMVELDFEGLTLDDGTTVPLGLVQSIVAGTGEG